MAEVEIADGRVPEAAGEAKLGFGKAVPLRLVKRIGGNVLLQRRGRRLGRAEGAALAQRDERLKEEPADGKPDDDILTRKRWASDEVGDSLEVSVSVTRSSVLDSTGAYSNKFHDWTE